MPTSYGLSYSTNSLPRRACTTGACERLGHGHELVVGSPAAGTGEDRHGLSAVEDLGRGHQRVVSGAHDRRARCDRARGRRARGVLPEDLARDHDDRDARRVRAPRASRSPDARQLLGHADQLASRRCTRGTAPAGASPGSSFAPISSRGMCAAIASTGTRLRFASNRPLIRCRLPGPQLAAQTASSAGHRRLAGRGERSRLLVPYVHPPDPAVAAHRVGEAVQRVPRQPIDAAYARRLERRNDDVGDRGVGHAAARVDAGSSRNAMLVPSP